MNAVSSNIISSFEHHDFIDPVFSEKEGLALTGWPNARKRETNKKKTGTNRPPSHCRLEPDLPFDADTYTLAHKPEGRRSKKGQIGLRESDKRIKRRGTTSHQIKHAKETTQQQQQLQRNTARVKRAERTKKRTQGSCPSEKNSGVPGESFTASVFSRQILFRPSPMLLRMRRRDESEPGTTPPASLLWR